MRLHPSEQQRLEGKEGRRRAGRKPLKGERLPTLQQGLVDPTALGKLKTQWQTLEIADWYGQGKRRVEIISSTCIWYHGGLPPVSIRWVLVRPVADGPKREQFDPRAFLCTDTAMKPEQILQYFMQRWQVEVTFQETRQHLGLETQREWNDKAIPRESPCILALYSLVTLIASHLVNGKDLPVRQDA